MNLFSSRLVLRPRLLTEVLDLAAPFALACGRPLATTALLVLGPLAALAAGLRLGMGWSWPALWGLMVPLGILSQGAFTIVLGEAMFNPPGAVPVLPLLRRYLARLPLLLLLHLTRLLVLLACLTVVLPAVIEGPRWLFLGEAALLEHAGLGQSISRSRALTRDRVGWSLMLALALLALPAATMMLAEQIGSTVLGGVLQLGQPLGSLSADGGSALALGGLLLGLPLAASVRFLGYIDLRTRREGWDIQLRFSAWEERAAARDRGPG